MAQSIQITFNLKRTLVWRIFCFSCYLTLLWPVGKYSAVVFTSGAMGTSLFLRVFSFLFLALVGFTMASSTIVSSSSASSSSISSSRTSTSASSTIVSSSSASTSSISSSRTSTSASSTIVSSSSASTSSISSSRTSTSSSSSKSTSSSLSSTSSTTSVSSSSSSKSTSSSLSLGSSTSSVSFSSTLPSSSSIRSSSSLSSSSISTSSTLPPSIAASHNSVLQISSSVSSVSSVPSFSSSATSISNSTTCTPNLSTITQDPMWGQQIIPENNCTTIGQNCSIIWAQNCFVSMGKTIQLSYWPTSIANGTKYPSTIVRDDLGITMTSPSAYVIVDTISAYNDCGQVGPTYTSAVLSFALSYVITANPYANMITTNRIGWPNSVESYLNLEDLKDCPSSWSSTPTEEEQIHPTPGLWNRCHPVIYWDSDFIQMLNSQYWASPYCSRAGGVADYGLYDPPYAIQPCSAGDDGCSLGAFTAASPFPSTTYTQATTAATPQLDIASSTSSAGVSATDQAINALPISGTTTGGSPLATPQTSVGETTEITQNTPTASVIVAIGTHTISALPGSSAIILPNKSIVSAGQVVTLSDAAGQAVTVSVGSTAVVVGGSSIILPAAPSPATTPNPIIALMIPTSAGAGSLPVTIGNQAVSIAAGMSAVIINSQTLSVSGAAFTDSESGAVATVGADGLVVHYTNGLVSSYALPVEPGSEQALATIETTLFMSAVGMSAVVVASQTISIGGPEITLSAHQVATLGPSGVVMYLPGGGVTTFSVPKPTTSATNTSTTTASEKVVDDSGANFASPLLSSSTFLAQTPTSANSPQTSTAGIGAMIYGVMKSSSASLSGPSSPCSWIYGWVMFVGIFTLH